MQLTTEQQSVIATNFNLVINAVAGSGKTTTLIEYARTRPPDSKILYLAFNKTVKIEAQQKFAAARLSNVQVETAHSLAFDRIIKHSDYKVVQGYKSYEWRDLLGINTGDLHSDYIIANHVSRFISYFCNSNAGKVQDLNYVNVVSDQKAKTFVNNFYKQIEKFTRAALAKMDKKEIPVTHDFYLKKFQLGNPQLDYDYILFDEGQDASAAMLEVFLQQSAIKIIVGDMHQQIYGWRYAINSLQQVDFPVYPLSNSFRFDEEVALVANQILAWKKHLQQEAGVKIIGVGSSKPESFTKATLGRTNLGLLLNAISQWQQKEISKLYFEGNINSYTFADEGASLYDVLNLYNGQPAKIKDKLIGAMKNMKELEEYIQKTEDNSLSMIVEVVKEFGNRLPGLIGELKTHHTTVKEEADMIFSTVHRCKGMEYDEVTLLNDFFNEEKLKKVIAQSDGANISTHDKNRLIEEVNILYVAATRAKNKLSIPPEINPLQTVKLAPSQSIKIDSSYRRTESIDDWDLRYRQTLLNRKLERRTGNHGKRWTEMEEELVERMFHEGTGIKEIAKKLERGESGVRIKLISMGLLQVDGQE